MPIIVKATKSSFNAPPVNVELYSGNRRIYYRSNMEHVHGILAPSNGGTGNSSFNENKVILYSKGKMISSNVSTKELEALKGITTPTVDDDGNEVPSPPLTEMIVSGIRTADNVLLDRNDQTREVKLPDFLPKTGGTISGDLKVNGKLNVGKVGIYYDETTQCTVFKVDD